MAAKEKILNYLKEKMEKTSLSERTLEGFADSYAQFFSDENTLTDEVLSTILTNVKNIEGQYSHDLSAGLKAAKAQLVKTDPQPNPQPDPQPQPEPNDQLLKAMEKLEKYDKLFEQISKEREATAAELAYKKLAEEVERKLIAAGCEEGIFLDYALTQMRANQSVEENVSALKAIYDKKMTDSMQSGAFVPQTVVASASAVTEEQQKQMMQKALDELREKHKI